MLLKRERGIMKKLAFIMFAVACVLNASVARAELAATLIEKNLADYSYAGLHSGKEGTYWISAGPEGSSSILLHQFTFSKQRKAIEVSVPKGLMLLTKSALSSGDDDFLVAGMSADGTWSMLKVSQAAKLLKRTELPAVEFISALYIGNQYILAAGQSKAGASWLAMLTPQLAIQREFTLPDSKATQIASAFAISKKIYLITNSLDPQGASYLWRLSDTFVIEDKKKLDGKGASGIAVGDSLAINYSQANQIFIENIDRTLRSEWKVLIVSRKGASTAINDLCLVNEDICLVGANNNRLFVARVKKDGTRLRLETDQKTNLLPPVNGYSVAAISDEVHIVGMAREKNGPVTRTANLFYFIDKP
jgi:hypothetical protein